MSAVDEFRTRVRSALEVNPQHSLGAEHAVTHSIATRLMRTAPSGDWVDVRGVLARRGRNLAFVTATATLEHDEPIAHGRITESIGTIR
ncbi:PaaI family thioesterase [Nocardia sp. NPDC003482]